MTLFIFTTETQNVLHLKKNKSTKLLKNYNAHADINKKS